MTLDVIHKVDNKQHQHKEAARLLGITPRQVRRLVKGYKPRLGHPWHKAANLAVANADSKPKEDILALLKSNGMDSSSPIGIYVPN